MFRLKINFLPLLLLKKDYNFTALVVTLVSFGKLSEALGMTLPNPKGPHLYIPQTFLKCSANCSSQPV